MFGFPLHELAEDDSRIVRYLTRAWTTEHGAPPFDLEDDLDKLRPLFQSHVTGTRVREHVKALTPVPMSRPFIPEVFFLAVDADRGLVTPEGRALIEAAQDPTTGQAAGLVNTIAQFYGESLRAWMAKSVETGLVPLPSAGFAMFLLINGSIGQQRAMVFPREKHEEADLATVIMDVASIFSTTVHGPAIKPKERAQLRTSWVVSQAVRHLGTSLSRGSDRKTGLASIWIEEDHTTTLLNDISVAIRARSRATPSDIEAAFDAAVAEYERGRVILGAWGISHERRRQTQQIREDFLEAFYRVRP
ncbi:hypothetical protein [Microbacterium sp. GCS4]|uniref:hypothetical protein n=1 Tax=Microbacterium sp. GCS4 TaxID=1692239 RepID=UPI00128FBEAB|nr:hypothetical protein [Microbacterium sp. GCS4]